MKVIGFVGSPRVGGNTETLIAEMLRGAVSVGAEVEQIGLNKLDISPCQACEACRKLKRCRIQDDMQPLYDKMLAADVIILGTPIYYWGPSAQLKRFIDRWYAIDQEGIREKLAGKRCQLICAMGDSNPETAEPTVSMMRTAIEWLEMQFAEPLLATGVNDRGEIAKNAEVMERAYRAGVRLVV